MKKMKWLWSYQIDKTEKWLSEMASNGYHLCDFNATTRMFTFDEGTPAATIYAIRLDKQALPSAMERAGWQVAASSNRWQFVKNDKLQVTTYPSREAIVKRTRMHAYLFILLATFLLSGQFAVFLMVAILSGASVSSIAIPLAIIIVEISLSIYVYRAYRKFEKCEMDLTVHTIGSGRKVRKMKLGWMYLPLQTKEWLEQQARLGLELERVYASIFTFRETGKQHIAYEVNFEPKVNSSFFTIHKEMGWQLKYASNLTWLHYSIWAMPYEDGAKMPALTYDAKEKIRSMKKALFMNVGIGIYILLICAYSLYVNFFITKVSIFEWSISGVLNAIVLAGTILWISLLSRTITGFIKEVKMVKAGL